MRKVLTENLALKIASVFLSIILWIFVVSRGQSEMSVDVPVEFKNIPSGLELVNQSAKTISLNIRGQERFLKSVKISEIRVSIDLGKAKRGESLYYINREDIKLARGITVMNMNPSSIKVITEETVSKTVRVLPVITGEPARGYYIKSIDVNPHSIVVEGIGSEVRRIGNIKTEPLDITGFKESFSQDVKLDLAGRNIRTSTSNITIKLVIGARGE